MHMKWQMVQPPILGYNADGSPIINSESGYSEEGFTEEADAEGYYPENTF